MRVLVLGGTGSIGRPLVRALIGRSHQVWALARSETSAAKLLAAGATPIMGDISAPEPWMARLPPIDGLIHTACDFDSDMAAIEARLLDAMLPHLAGQPSRPRLLYTGGCWLFGATGDEVATEATPFDPLATFAWMVPQLNRVLTTAEIDGIVIHPAMVYTESGGVFDRFAREARQRNPIRVVDSKDVRWPLVHSEDLAELYVAALERAPARSSYLGAAIPGFSVGRIARAFARRFATPAREPDIVSADAIAAELGDWARGYARDQQLSGAKARAELGWQPRHLDPEQDIARWP